MPTNPKKESCLDRVEDSLRSRMEDISNEDTNLEEYGLCFDYVPVNTFDDQKRGYWRWQLSYGGPSDEFRFYGEQIDDFFIHIDTVEYWFLDWGDGAVVDLMGEARSSCSRIPEAREWAKTIAAFLQCQVDTGIAQEVRRKANEILCEETKDGATVDGEEVAV